jgi:hypothetical protein
MLAAATAEVAASAAADRPARSAGTADTIATDSKESRPKPALRARQQPLGEAALAASDLADSG